jgi:hypothetical protein
VALSNKKYCFDNKVEFYITNVCNLTCTNCNRFNNYDFTGWQRWSDYESDYQKLSEYIGLKAIVLMGGEPLLNPTVTEWITGLNNLFEADIQVLTNGTRLNKVSGLYDTMVAKVNNKTIWNHVGVSLHNLEHFEPLREEIQKFLSPPFKEWGSMIGVDKPDIEPNWGSIYSARDHNNVIVNMFLYDSFSTAALQKTQQGFVLFNNDPVEAHSQCGFARYKSYHFIRGKVYKCGPVALFPEFDQQHSINISSSDRELLNSYQPLTANNIEEYGNEFFAKLDDPIPQCKFCPVNATNFDVAAQPKGSKLI